MHTDASHRFERGADIGLPPQAVDRAAALVAELAGGTVLRGAIDVFPTQPEPQVLDLHLQRLNRFAGVEFAAEDVERWLTGLGFELEAFPSADESPAWRVAVPTWRRRDVELPADLYEEVVRVFGYDNIPATLPAIHGADGHTSDAHRRGWTLRRRLAACGFHEAITFAFHGAEEDAWLPGLLADHPSLELANPLSELYRVMRRSLLPNLLASARFNQRRGAAAVQLFEIGHVFARAEASSDEPITEFETVALVAGGELGGPWDRSRELDFFDLKGVVEQLAVDVEQPLKAKPAQRSGFAPGTTAELWLGDRLAGYLGLVLGEDDVYPLFAAELRTDLLAARPQPTIEAPSRFPGVRADLTLTHSLAVPWADLEAAIRSVAPEHLVDFGLQDRYQGKGVPSGAVNTTIYFLYSSIEGTLTQEEVNERQGSLAQELERRFGWKG
jgi:phenylalanyl-tRNA synthetase beta chain